MGVAAAAQLPVLLAWWLTPPGYHFTGLLMNPLDNAGYLAEMRQAARGAWLLYVPFISEPHSPSLFHPQYILLGKLAGLTGLPEAVVFHAARFVFGVALLLVGFALIAAATPLSDVRRDACLLLATAGGLTWLSSFAGVLGADVTIPESLTIPTLLGNPHFPLATAMFFGAALAVLGSYPRFGPRLAYLAFATTVMTAIQPFLLVSLGLVLAGWALVMLRGGDRLSRYLQAPLWLPLLLPVPVAAYLALNLYGDPALAGWMAQNASYSPPPGVYLLGYGLAAPLALAGVWAVVRTPGRWFTVPAGRLLVAWLVVGGVVLYTLGPWQRRLSEGYHMPVALLAVAGFYVLLRPRLTPRAFRAARVLLIGLGVTGSLWIAGIAVIGALAVRERHYVTHEETHALAWLAEHAPRGTVVLAGPATGAIIPLYSDATPYWGHPVETLNSDRKREQVDRFFAASTTSAERCRLLAATGAGLVYHGPLERARGAADLSGQPGLTPAFASGDVAIYRTAPCRVGT